MTPQPQPASYWIALLDELTGGLPFEIINVELPFQCTSLSSYAHWHIPYGGIDGEFRDAIMYETNYLTSGQAVIDAAVEALRLKNTMNLTLRFNAENNLDEQTRLYLRCNGVEG